jgi:hypothetical protein
VQRTAFAFVRAAMEKKYEAYVETLAAENMLWVYFFPSADFEIELTSGG